MAIDMDAMLAKIKDRQWALADIDWDATGAELISDEQRPKLKAFMADLCWIENIGARGFAALAKKAPTPTIAEIYRYFHAEEQRHANAELALMKRWGMLEDGEMPEPNVNIRLAIEWLDRYADGMSLSILGTVIPMLEVALDGALLKFLLDEVDDPVCHQVFEKINNDESRHIAVNFEVLNMIGGAQARRLAIEFVGNIVSPGLIIGAIMYAPLLNRIRNEIVGMGMEPDRLYNAVKRFKQLGERGEETWRVPTYQVLKRHASVVVKPRHPYHLLANSMVWASDRYPKALLRPIRRGSRNSPTSRRPEMATHTYDTLIVGAGFTGIGTAIKLTQAGVDDFVILEREDRVGGTWRDNTYPGAACDVPSLLYSFSFVKNPNWSRAYSPAGEICEHIEDMVDAFDLRRRIQFGVQVTGLRFDDQEGVWTVRQTGANGSEHEPSFLPPAR
jgi:hypothetical protein